MEEEWIKKRRVFTLDMEGERAHQICSFLWADNFWIMSHSKEHLEQMLRDHIEEANKRRYLGTTGCDKFPLEDTFKMLGCAVNRQGETCDAVEERMQTRPSGRTL